MGWAPSSSLDSEKSSARSKSTWRKVEKAEVFGTDCARRFGDGDDDDDDDDDDNVRR